MAGNGKKNDKIEYFYDNLLMVENLLKLSDRYKKLILFDSGASFDREFDIFNRKEEDFRTVPIDFYGLSKYINTKRVENNHKIINLRLFNVFGPKERNFRFIKTCIQKCIKNEEIHIWEDMFFSFFYIEDSFIIINHLIQFPPINYYELNCVYQDFLKLSDIANLIKFITSSKSDIIVDKISDINYHGNGDKLNNLGLKFKGLDIGIKECYEYIKNYGL